MERAADPSLRPEVVLVDSSFCVVHARGGAHALGRPCYEVMAGRRHPCRTCPVYELRRKPQELRPAFRIERVGENEFEWVSVQMPRVYHSTDPHLQCSRIPLGDRMSRALSALCKDERNAELGHHVEELANKVQGISLALELLRSPGTTDRDQRLLDGMEENCRSLVEDIERVRLHLLS